MANRDFAPSQSYGSGRVYCDFLFQTNAGSSPLVSTVDGADVVSTITRTGTGVIVIVLKDSFNKAVYASADVDDTANDGAYATVGNLTNEGTATGLQFTIRTRTAGGTLADMAAARVIHVTLALRNGNWGQK